jgi:tRNA threonylcarbamoyladenosine biosynthesis protein TsaB
MLLGIDTCGPTGSVALGRLSRAKAESMPLRDLEILGQIELDGRSYSSTLVSAVADLLKDACVELNDLSAIVAVNGPGSFTGVRVGLSAVKGLAEVSRIPVIAISRLEVLAAKAGAAKASVEAAALDAHRGEVFLRFDGPAAWRNTTSPQSTGPRAPAPAEMLASASELKAIIPAPAQVAVCDEAATVLLESVWPTAELLRVAAPTAADALRLVGTRLATVCESKDPFVDLALPDVALLDGNYLRRSDAEIFGQPTEAQRR